METPTLSTHVYTNTMLGFIESLRRALWSTNTVEESRDKPIRKETTTLNGRVTRYDKATGSGMINHSVYFHHDVIVGGGRPQVGGATSF